MSGQFSIPFGGAPPSVDVETSKAAAAALLASGKWETLRDKVHAYIICTGEYGATDAEIERGLGMRHQTASARRNELVKLGLVVDSGQRRPTPSGRPAIVWRRVSPGQKVRVEQQTERAVLLRKLRRRLADLDLGEIKAVWAAVTEIQGGEE